MYCYVLVKSADFLIKQHDTSWNNGLVISSYVFLPFLIIGAIIAFKRNKSKIFLNREDTVSKLNILYLINEDALWKN